MRSIKIKPGRFHPRGWAAVMVYHLKGTTLFDVSEWIGQNVEFVGEEVGNIPVYSVDDGELKSIDLDYVGDCIVDVEAFYNWCFEHNVYAVLYSYSFETRTFCIP